MTQITLTLLGTFDVMVPDQQGAVFATDKARGLLAYLALQPALAHRRETLAALFWPLISQQAALTNLRQTFYRLREGLERIAPGSSDALFQVTRRTLQLNLTALTVDALRFTTLLTESETHAHATLAACEPCLARLAQTVTLYRGELLAGLGLVDAPAFEEWLLLRRELYHQQALLALQKLTLAYEARGDYEQAHAYAHRQVELDPYREDAHRQVMRLLALCGLPSQALVQYERCHQLLYEELGVEPDAETIQLVEQIRTGKLGKVTRLCPEAQPEGWQGDKGHPSASLRTSRTRGEGQESDDEDEEILELQSKIQNPKSAIEPPPHPVIPHNLPVQLTPLVGREQAVADLCARLQDPAVRLLTIVGAGGMGKTRLALGVAEMILDFGFWILDLSGEPRNQNNPKSEIQNPKFPDGVFFVSLAPLTVTGVAPAIATALGLNWQGDPQQAVLQGVRNQQLLLILDNFEHLLEAVGFVVDLLQAAPALRILVTSRERLNVRGEHLYLIPALDYGQESPGVTMAADEVAAARTLSSVQLFTQSVQRMQAKFVVNAETMAAVLRICRLVQGMPLGLELAAAWVGTLPLPEIADAIAQSGDFLSADWRDVPTRQRSLRMVFEWSWQLLNELEQRMLRQLAVFQGGFTRSAAQAVTGVPLPVLTRLVHKSLVQWAESEPASTGGRYTFHELLRQFAAEKLEQLPDERALVQTAHSRYYLTYVAERTLRLVRREPLEAGAELQHEIDNIRQAWTWAARQSDVTALDQAAYGWWQFCVWRGLMAEVRQSFALAIHGVRAWLAQGEASGNEQHHRAGKRLLSKLLAIHANLLFAQGVDEQMAAEAEEAIALGQANGSREGESFGHFVLGRAYQEFEKTADAIAMWQTTLLLARADQQSPAPSAMVRDAEWMAQLWLRGAALAAEDYAASRGHMLQALQSCQALGHVRGELNCLTNLAWHDFMVGDYTAAQQRFEQGFQLACALRHRWAEMATGSGLGEVMRLQGKYSQALDWLVRSLAIAVEYSPYDEALLLALLVRLHSYLGDQVGAEGWRRRLFGMLERSQLPKDCQRQGLLAAAVKAYAAGEAQAALAYAEQARQLTGPGEISTVRADGLVILGHAQAGTQQWAAAIKSYGEAITDYRKVGNLAAATEAQAGLAQIALAQGDPGHAQHWVDALLPVLAAQPSAGFTTPFFTYHTCYRVLAANQDRRAPAVLEQGCRLLLDYAARISDLALKRSFLENVAVHRELQTLHQTSG